MDLNPVEATELLSIITKTRILNIRYVDGCGHIKRIDLLKSNMRLVQNVQKNFGATRLQLRMCIDKLITQVCTYICMLIYVLMIGWYDMGAQQITVKKNQKKIQHSSMNKLSYYSYYIFNGLIRLNVRHVKHTLLYVYIYLSYSIMIITIIVL